MHEVAIAQAILDHVQRKLSSLPERGRAESVRIKAGEFRNVDPASLRFAFESLAALYPACAGCDLEIDVVPALARCRSADHCYRATMDDSFRCPECGSGIGTLLSGEELEITDIAVELEK